MLSAKDKELMRPFLISTRDNILKVQPKLEGMELVDTVCDAVKSHGISPAAHAVLITNFYAPDTQKWLMKLIAGVDL